MNKNSITIISIPETKNSAQIVEINLEFPRGLVNIIFKILFKNYCQ